MEQCVGAVFQRVQNRFAVFALIFISDVRRALHLLERVALLALLQQADRSERFEVVAARAVFECCDQRGNRGIFTREVFHYARIVGERRKHRFCRGQRCRSFAGVGIRRRFDRCGAQRVGIRGDLYVCQLAANDRVVQFLRLPRDAAHGPCRQRNNRDDDDDDQGKRRREPALQARPGGIHTTKCRPARSKH